ncbi:MAG: peptide ABC transporter substrate-binding protein [Spirochaetaceae bacterium]|jgi:peptide/nickel transport system substrate-binding protein/oligopeptide transport system substrate-binding protein|nr:peptide ABC transporter substrate-binding protein [Spirochaetaceae bacterium]
MKTPGAFILKTGFLWLVCTLASCANLPGREERSPSEAGDGAVEHPRLSREEPDLAATRPRSVVRDALTITFSSGDVELDVRKSFLSSEAQLFTALYEGLFSYHPVTMDAVPAAASQWSVSEDKKQWTFTIRPNARYWNGDPVEAEHFRSAWLSLLNPEHQSPYSSLFDIIEGARDYRTGKLKDPSRVGVAAKDKHTLVVRLTDPAAFFRSMLCHHSFSPIHPSMLEKKNWSVAPPLSNGPFYIAEHRDTQMILLKNESYWDARNVALNKLVVKFTEDGQEAAALWNTGEARWVSGDVDIDGLTDRSGIMVNPMFATHYYFIRSAEKPWNDYRVRRALSLALPWDEIRRGYYLPAKTLVYPIAGYPQVRGIEAADTETARRLLSEAGYPKGAGLPALVIKITPAHEAERVGSLMAQAWMGDLGVPVKITVVPFGQYFQALKQNDYGVGSTTWIGDFADPYTFLQMWRRDSNLNDAGYNDADYEKLIDRSMMEEGMQRMETLAEAEKLLLERGSVLPIYYSPALNIVDVDEIDGWYPNALDIHPFKYLSFKAVKPLPGVASVKRLVIPASGAP